MLHVSRSNFRYQFQPQGVYSPNLNFHPSALGSSWATTRRNLVSKWRVQAREFRRKRSVVGPIHTSTGALTGSSGWIATAHAATLAKACEFEGGAVDQRFGPDTIINPRPQTYSSLNSAKYSKIELLSRVTDQYCLGLSYLEDFDQYVPDLDQDLRRTIDMEKRQKSPEQFLAAKKREAVATVMAVFNKWLDKRLSVMTYAYEASDGSQEAPDKTASSRGSNSSRQGSDRSGRTRAKRQLSEDDNTNGSSGGGDGDGHDEDRGSNKRARKDAEEKRLFACPFYQHDPKHCTHRSCTGPGWATIHRLKEHLNRNHRLPKHVCLRCREPWADAAALEMHLRSDVACVKREVVRYQGIDDAQEKKLKERKKTSGSLTDEQKWRDIYMILFPSANKKALPSPYYDSRDAASFAKSAAQWKQIRKHIQKELPQAVQKRVEQRFDGVQAEVLHGLSDIVRDEIFHILKGFPQGMSAPTSPGPASRSPTPKVPETLVVAPTAAAPSGALSLDSLFDETSGINLFAGFNDAEFDQQFDFGTECFSDSGYNSVSTVSAPVRDTFTNWSF